MAAERGERGYDGRDGAHGKDGLNGINGINGVIPVQLLGDHDLLIRLDTKMDTILERLERGDVCMEEHNQRITSLELFRNSILAYVTCISLIISGAGTWLLNHVKVG